MFRIAAASCAALSTNKTNIVLRVVPRFSFILLSAADMQMSQEEASDCTIVEFGVLLAC